MTPPAPDEPAAPQPKIARFVLEAPDDADADGAVLVTGADTFAGLTDSARSATVQRMLHQLRIADGLLDAEHIRRAAHDLDHLTAVADCTAAMVLAEAARIYGERLAEECTDTDAAAYDIPEPSEEVAQAAQARLAASLRAGLAENPATGEQIHRYLLQHLTAWALRDMERDYSAERIQAMPEAEFQQHLRQYFDPLLRDGLRDLLVIYAGEFGQAVLETIAPQQLPLAALRRILTDGVLPPNPVPVPRDRPRPSNRKIALPWPDGTLFGMPNIHNHGVRNLARIAAGDAAWEADPAGGPGQVAVVDGKAIGRVDFTPGQEAAERALLDLLSPRAIKTMVATSRLIIEGTNRDPLNRAVTLRASEVARAMGYKPDKRRSIDPVTIRRVAGDVHLLSKVATWAADGPYDPKTKGWRSGWVAPLIAITAVHVAQTAMDGPPLPYEFDAMLGRNWAQALLDSDLVQIAPGLMELHDESAIRLAWYYLTEFRYRMTKPKAGAVRKIAALCAEARIDTGQPKHRGRFLSRLEQWHAQLATQAIIGTYTRSPSAEDVEHDNAWTPARVFAEGAYHVEPPAAILEAYERTRQRALTSPKGKRGRPARA